MGQKSLLTSEKAYSQLQSEWELALQITSAIQK
jgi:hypothetical protein